MKRLITMILCLWGVTLAGRVEMYAPLYAEYRPPEQNDDGDNEDGSKSDGDNEDGSESDGDNEDGSESDGDNEDDTEAATQTKY